MIMNIGKLYNYVNDDLKALLLNSFVYMLL